MEIEIRKMETDGEIRGKAYVHWAAWHVAYAGLVSPAYLDKLTLEKCEELAFQWRDNLLIAKDGERVIGFLGYGSDLNAADTGMIFALYVLPEYWGKGVSQKLTEAGLLQLSAYPKIALWVLKENARAIRFYEKCGFLKTGEEKELSALSASEIRMAMNRKKEYAFTSELIETPENGGAYLIFPWDIRTEFKKGRVKVHATFDGVPYDGSIVNMGVKDVAGNTCYIIGVRKDIRKQLGKKHGDAIRVIITEREADV